MRASWPTVFAAVVCVFALACGGTAAPTERSESTGLAPTGERPGSEPTATSTRNAPVATPTTTPGRQRARVVMVVNGDTMDVELGGVTVRVRYIGVDTPETVDPRRPVGCFGAEASERNKALVDGRTVELEKD